MNRTLNMVFKVLCVIIIGMITIASTCIKTEALQDIPSTWAAAEVEAAGTAGLIPSNISLGYKDAATRSEFCQLAMKMIMVKTGYTIPEFLSYKGLETDTLTFTDTTDEMILAANALGIVNGIGGGLFNPSGNIERQQAAAILARVAKVLDYNNPNDSALVFADSSTFDSYAVDSINFISSCSDRINMKRVMSGVGQNKFDPKSSYTKEQAILTMIRLFNSFDYEVVSVPIYIESIEGIYMKGNVLTAGRIEYDILPQAEPVYQWQWLRSDTEDGIYETISGATNRQYTASEDNVDKYINVSVVVSGSAKGIAISTPVKIEAFKLFFKPIKPIEGFYPVQSDGTPTSPFLGGKGTQSEPYLISNAEQFLLLKDNTIDTYFKLNNDITLPLNEVINTKFYGHLDGNNKKITMSSNIGRGLFHEIVSGASVENLIVAGGMTGSKLKGIYIGRLANSNYGNIIRCGSDMSSMLYKNSVNLRVGGLVGKNYGMISECYSTGIIKVELEAREAINGMYPSLLDDLISDWNKGWLGGLVGINMVGGSIRNSYSQANVIIDAPGELSFGIIGGLISKNYGNVINCYSTGSVSKNKYRGGLTAAVESGSVIESSYYDKETSGRGDTGKGNPKTTAQMKNQSTYIGWSSDIWKFFGDRSSYPILKWQK